MYNQVKITIFYIIILTILLKFSIILIGTFKNPTNGINTREILILIKKGKKKMNTFMAKESDVKREWYVIDAEGQNLGRLASKVATVLRGKHKAIYTPNVDCGDYVIVINASKVNLTGNKLEDKVYFNHSDYPGGVRLRTAKEMRANYSEEMITRAVKGMLPKGRLGRAMIKKLFVYAGSEHKQQAQQPKELK
jgi:large subunit ribosomal protein L13